MNVGIKVSQTERFLRQGNMCGLFVATYVIKFSMHVRHQVDSVAVSKFDTTPYKNQ
jgi:hypothetical protein